MKNCTCAFHKATVESFSYSIMLRHIGGGEASFSALLLKISSKFIAGELTTVIGMESFDVCAVLSSSPRRKGLIGLEGFVLELKHFKPSEAGVIVSKCHIVLLSSQA